MAKIFDARDIMHSLVVAYNHDLPVLITCQQMSIDMGVDRRGRWVRMGGQGGGKVSLVAEKVVVGVKEDFTTD